jgi:hypothetical protein
MAKVRHWLTSVEVDHTLRLEPLLRSIFFSCHPSNSQPTWTTRRRTSTLSPRSTEN